DGIIVNVARGAVINEKELVDCLLKGEIAGAGLDVFENEPDVPEEFFQLDNVVMTPHRAVMTEESLKDLYELVVRNLDAFFTNKPLMFEVM
nr:glyoxylate/hydroxypyruvate reductase HPR3-like [Tanacetum cinerariifolium]